MIYFIIFFLIKKLFYILSFFFENTKYDMKLNTYNIEGRTIREEKLLSEGGYGYIFKVVDINTREVFALKKSYC